MKRFMAFAAAMVLPAAVAAQELRPLHNYSIHFGPVSGSVYVDQTDADPNLVATLSSGDNATPVRFVTSMAAGQRTTVSVPRGVGEPAFEVTFLRRGNQVFVLDSETIVGSIK